MPLENLRNFSHTFVDSNANTTYKAEDRRIAETVQIKESEQDWHSVTVTVLAGLHSIPPPL